MSISYNIGNAALGLGNARPSGGVRISVGDLVSALVFGLMVGLALGLGGLALSIRSGMAVIRARQRVAGVSPPPVVVADELPRRCP